MTLAEMQIPLPLSFGGSRARPFVGNPNLICLSCVPSVGLGSIIQVGRDIWMCLVHPKRGASLGEVTHNLPQLRFSYGMMSMIPLGPFCCRIFCDSVISEEISLPQISLVQCLTTFLTLQLGTSLVSLASSFGLTQVRASAGFSWLNIAVWCHFRCQWGMSLQVKLFLGLLGE